MGWNIEEPRRNVWNSNRLTFEILKFPLAYVPDKREPLTKLDDKRFVIDNALPPKAEMKIALFPFFITMAAVGVSLVGALINPGLVPSFKTLDIYVGFPVVGAIISTMLIIINKIKGEHKLVIFDRMTQAVTLHRGLKRRPWTYPFEKMVPLVGTHVLPSVGLPLGVYFALKPPRDIRGEMITLDNDPWKTWSFIVWYMDKNRPLPPSPTLDPYREADRKRREAEGNPEPYARMHPGVLEELRAYNESRVAEGLDPIEELAYDKGYQREDEWSRYYGGR